MTDRFFAFGCSFTKNTYPTWADIVGSGFSYYENWAKPGGGNHFIFNSLIECIKRNNINSNDTVIIMWTSIGREDRYTQKHGWVTPGSIYNQTVYDTDFIKQFADPTGYLLRDLAFIASAQMILASIGCTYYFLSTVPICLPDDNTNLTIDIDQSIANLYKDELAAIKPSVYQVIFNNNWYSRPGPVNIAEVQQEYNACKGPNWPSWEKFVLQEFTNVPAKIVAEINEQHQLTNKLTVRSDTHPTTAEHLEYLQKVLPEIPIPTVLSKYFLKRVNRF
jgi:hypothetical protein